MFSLLFSAGNYFLNGWLDMMYCMQKLSLSIDFWSKSTYSIYSCEHFAIDYKDGRKRRQKKVKR